MSGVPIQVAVTGAAGQIGYSLLFRLASARCSARPADRPAHAGDRAGDEVARGRRHGARRLRLSLLADMVLTHRPRKRSKAPTGRCW